MKRIATVLKLCLAFVLVAATVTGVQAQGCLTTVLPNDASTSPNARTPMSTFSYARCVYLIKPSEMAAAPGFPSGSQPLSIAWTYTVAAGISATAPLAIYMQNTADVTNTKSTAWATAVSGMTQVHNASTTLPSTATTFEITLSAGAAFTYTGGGLYIAFDWGQYTGTLTTIGAPTASCNSTGLVNGLLSAQSTTATQPTTMGFSSFRPQTLLRPVAGLANDASVDLVMSLGSQPLGITGAQTIQARVSNKGSSAISNLAVTLTISGANSFTNTQIVPALALCGGAATVTFAPFTATALGSNTVTVSIPADQAAVNNSLSKPMNVTVPLYSYKHPGTAANGGVGLNGAMGAFVAKFNTTQPTSVTAANLEFFSVVATTYRVAIYGDAGGIPSTTPLYVDAADRTILAAGPVTITLPAPVPVGPGNFYVGVQQTNTTNASYSFDNEAPLRSGAFYFAGALPVTAWSDLAPANGFKLNIGATLDRCNFTPSASNNGPFCPGGNLQLNSSATGAASYAWTGPNSFTSNQQNPLITGATAAAGGTYTVTVNGCASGTPTTATALADTDGDGTCDINDGCPNDPNKIAPGNCGCGVAETGDTDGDGAFDCNDGCPTDPTKIAPGQCGCGVADTDTDGDGVANCIDSCPLVTGQIGSACNDGDPNTIADQLDANCVCVGQTVDCLGVPGGTTLPGTTCDDNNACTINDVYSPTCVCVGTFQDTDGDGTCDANDGCPNDPNKIAPGICGCGTADTDTDGDGIANCNDNCPLVTGVQGSSCTDGNPCTINDVLNASCVCTGTPAPVVPGVSGNQPSYCTPGPGVVLTASGGVSYTWAPAAGLSATTGNPVTATPASATTYTVTVTNAAGCTGTATVSVGSGASPVISSTTATPATVCPGSNSQLLVTTPTTPYCVPPLSFGCSFPDQISQVTVAGIVRSSGCDNLSGSNGYSYFSGGPSGTLVAGSTGNAYSVTTSGDLEGATIWIDYNKNGTFDVGEQVFNSYAGTNPATYSGTFTVPAGAINGVTRLRVRCTYAAAPGTNACGGAQTTYGETEDYNVTITGGASPLTYSWTPATYLSSTTISNPVATAVTTTTPYTVTVTNGAGCSAQGTVTVSVETTDTDGDGTVDCLDGCPADPSKIAPGQCGCGAPDTDTDSDGTADCNDGCINDPNKIAPGICGCGTADTDTDTDGTADCFDLCPNDANKIVPGQCGCGTPDTDGDGDGIADCVDNCPGVAGVQGTPCNDGNAATINDVITASCVCAGTVPTCAFNTVLLDLVTDNDGGQTSWDVVNISTTNVVCSGSGYLNNQTITLDCCLPDGCYELRVFDSAGDGMANGPVGGYVLRQSAGNKRIIDNGGDGIFTSTSTIANNQGFCVPLGNDGVIAAHCDKNNWLPNDVIQATVNPAVTGQFGVSNANSGYQFWFFNPDGGYSRRITQTHAAPGAVSGPPASQRAAFLRLSAVVTQPIPFYTNLNIRIRTQVAGVFSEFGPACRFRLDPPCTTTQLTTVADPVVSCGATGLTLSSQIYATTVAGASTYQFEFSKGAYLRRIAVSVRNVALSFTTSPLQNNTCYNVRVRISFDGGLTYCPFGPSCTITIGTALCGGAMALEGDGVEGTTSTANVHVWPNPNDGQLVNISLTEFDQTVTNVMVDVTDVYGKLISTRNIAGEGGYLNTVLPFDQDLAPGLYLVNLTAGDKRYTERLVIQR